METLHMPDAPRELLVYTGGVAIAGVVEASGATAGQGGERIVKRRLLVPILGSMLLAVTACTVPLAGDGSGYVGLLPFFAEAYDVRGVVPVACHQGDPGNFECRDLTQDRSLAYLVLQVFPGAMDELIPVLLDELSLERFVEPVGSYEGRALTWDLCTFEHQFPDLGPETFRVNLALAEGDERSYLVALATLPDVYDAHAALYDTVFVHTVYAFAPLDR
jgi:hypothetical protein